MLVWLLGTALAGSLPARPTEGPPHGPPPGGPHGPPPPELLVDRAEDAGLPAETVAALRERVDASEGELDAARERARTAHDALFTLLTATQNPDRARVLRASADLAVAEGDLREVHLGLELELRALLTAEQWAAVSARPPHPPRGPR